MTDWYGRPVSRTPWCMVRYGVINSRQDEVVSRHGRRLVANLFAWLQRGWVRRQHRLGHRRAGVEVRWLP